MWPVYQDTVIFKAHNIRIKNVWKAVLPTAGAWWGISIGELQLGVGIQGPSIIILIFVLISLLLHTLGGLFLVLYYKTGHTWRELVGGRRRSDLCGPWSAWCVCGRCGDMGTQVMVERGDWEDQLVQVMLATLIQLKYPRLVLLLLLLFFHHIVYIDFKHQLLSNFLSLSFLQHFLKTRSLAGSAHTFGSSYQFLEVAHLHFWPKWVRERFKKIIKLQTLSEWGGGLRIIPFVWTQFLFKKNMTFRHKLYINMVN